MDALFIRSLLYLYSSLFFLTPLLMFHRTSELFEFNKILFIYLVTIFVSGLWLARMIVHKRIIIKNTLLSLPLGLFFASQIASTFLSIDKTTSFFGYYGRFNGGLLSIAAYIILYLAFVSNFSTKDTLKKAIRYSLVSSVLGAVVVMLWGLPSKFGFDLSCLVFTGKFDVACWTEQFKPTIRVFSTLGQSNWLGAYLAVQFFIGTYFFFLHRDNKRHSFIYGAFLFLTVIMLLYTRSRSALLSIAVGMIIVAAFLIRERAYFFKKVAHKKQIGLLCAVLFVGLLIAKTGVDRIDAFIPFSRHTVETKMVAPQDAPKNIVITDSFTIRKIVWQGGFNLGRLYPLFGSGVETFAYSYNFVRPREHNMTSEWDFVYNKAHNELVNYLATTGYVGLLTYLIFLGVVVSQLIHAFKQNDLDTKDRFFIVCMEAGFVSLIVTNFLGFSTTVSNVYLYLLPAFIILTLLKNQVEKNSDEKLSRTLTDIQKGFLVTIGIGMALGTVWVFNYWRADMHYAKGESLSSFQEYGTALNELYKAYSIRNEHVYADKISHVLAQITLSQTLSTKGKRAECPSHEGLVTLCADLTEKYQNEALAGSPKNVAYYRTAARNNILLYQATQNKQYYDKAQTAIKKARDLAPTDPRYPYTQALFYLAQYETTPKPTADDKKNLERSGLASAEFALQLKPDYRDGYYAKGLILKQIGKKEEARALFNEYLEKYNSQDEQILKELKAL